MPPVIRSVIESDIKEITEIYNHYIANSVATFEQIAIDSEEMAKRIDASTSANLPWLVAENGTSVLGYAYATKWRVRSAYKHSVEITVYKSPNVQTKGVGSALYKVLFEELRKLSMHVVIAGISLPNPPSIALHEKFGMTKVAEFKQVGRKFDRWVDTGYWQKLL